MKKTDKPTDAEQVQQYMDALEHPMKEEINALRSIIQKANKKLAERIKWNVPSFYYKNDMLAFHLRGKGFIQLVFVFYNGDMITGSDGLLEGDYKDRRLAKFTSMSDIKAKKTALENVINQWMALMDK